MPGPTRDEALAIQKAYLAKVGWCVSVLLIIHALPMQNVPNDPFRFWCMLAYFVALGGLGWLMLGAREKYLAAWYGWRYEEAPPPLQATVHRYLMSLAKVVRVCTYLYLALVGSIFVGVIIKWFPFLGALQGMQFWVWLFALAGIGFLPFVGGFLFQELVQRWLAMHEQSSSMAGLRPRPVDGLHLTGAFDPTPQPLKITGPLTFAAGGFDWNWSDFYKNAIVFGEPGSGKTSCVLNSLLDGLLASAREGGIRPSGLILDPKGDFADKIQTLAVRYGWREHLVILDPSQPETSIRWNPFDVPPESFDAYELASRFVAVMETLGMKNQDTSFWIDSAKTFLRHTIAMLDLTRSEPPSLVDVQRSAMDPTFLYERATRLDLADDRCDECLTYLANEWGSIAPQTRTAVQMQLSNMLDPFSLPDYRRIFSGPSTIRIADIVNDGKLLYVHMPLADKEAMARTVATLIKLEYFREVLRRPNKERPSFFLCDEFQSFFTHGQGKGDADFFERSRQSRHANVIVTHNISSLVRYCPRKEIVTNLLGLCAVKIFLRNTDEETNQYASHLFGQHVVAMGSSGSASGPGRLHGMGQTSSSTDQYDAVVRPERFAELQTPLEEANIDSCQSIVFRPTASGDAGPKRGRWKRHPI